MPISTVVSSCTEAEFAKWTRGSTWSRSKKILRPPKSIGRKLRANLQLQRWPQNTRHTSFYSPTTGHESSKKRSKSWSSSSRITRTRSLSWRTWMRRDKIKKFREESKKLITDMGNTEIFELYETSPKKHWPDFFWRRNRNCLLFMWEMSNTFAKYSTSWTRRTSTPCQFQVTSSKKKKKNLLRGAKHGASERQRMYHNDKFMLQKARQPKHGGYKTILERWHNDDKYRESLSDNWVDLKNKIFSMTNLHWKITPTLQQEGKEIVMRKVGYSSWIKKVLKDQWINDQISLKQMLLSNRCPLKQNEKWKDCVMNMWKRLQKETHPFILYNDQDSEGGHQFEGLEEYNYQTDAQNRMENLSFEVKGKLVAESNTFVLVKSMGGWSEVEQKLEFLAILILDRTEVIS